jgi:beta-glucanase (GH16 family)
MSFKNLFGPKPSLLIGFLLLALFATFPAVGLADIEVFDDMEHGDPGNNGWFAFGGSVGGGGIAPNNVDLPPANGGAFSLETGWGSGGVPGFYGGFGRTNPSNLSGTAYFSFWINPDAGQDYTLEINLQDDDNGDGAINPPDDDEFQYNCVVSPTGPCAVAGGGWQLVTIPLADFFDDNSVLTGGNGVLDPVPPSGGGNGELINVIMAVIGNSGSDVNFRTDYWVFSLESPTGPTTVIDDFEDGLAVGGDANGNPVGFYIFTDGSPVAIATTSAPPAPRPESDTGNTVLEMVATVSAFAGYIHAFENSAVDTWVTQDWSASEGIRFWMYGQNTGTEVFIDILENRNPGSTVDDAERWTVPFVDDFSGWQLLEFPFSTFVRKEIGNGAPNDGLTLFEVHGYAIGTLGTPGELTFYFDQVALYGVAEIPELTVQFGSSNFDIPEGATGDIVVKLNRPMNEDDPAAVDIDYYSDESNAAAGRDYTPVSGTLSFVNGGPSELSFSLETFDDNKYTGDQRVILRLANPVDVAMGPTLQAAATIIDDESFDPLLVDDFEDYPWLWWSDENVLLDWLEIESGDPDALPGQGAFEGVLTAIVPLGVDIDVQGRICNQGNGVIPVALLTTDTFDATTVDHTTVTLGDAHETHTVGKTSEPKRHEEDADGDGDIDLVFHFRFEDTGLGCDPLSTPFNGLTFDGQPIAADDEGASFGRDFALGRNWSSYDGLTFWYYGQNTGDVISVDLLDNRAPDPGPGGWELVWADEFDEPAGTPPDPANWAFETGDGALNGIPGWGNDELQYYTDSTDNVATDGDGHLLITTRAADGSLQCYYGPCEYTSARLLSQNRAEFAYGRIEARVLLPDGDAGLWPAFWSLGTDIGEVGWPQTGEIDFMEYVSRLPNEIFGTIHGPGYSGGDAFGNVWDFGEPAYNDFREFVVEWEPDLIRWYVDGILYHSAAPDDVAPNEWVFNDPVFMLLNQAVGGNFGGAVSPDLNMPQTLAIDYVRVYQGPDTAERWEATFTDDFEGWQQVSVPFASFTRSDGQPDGAPNDGLNLTEVWGYGFTLPDGGSASGHLMLDQVRLVAPTVVTVVNLDDDGVGSLRWAINRVATGGLVNFDPALAGSTIDLTSGPLVIGKDVTLDGSGAPGIAVSGGGTDRVMIVDAGAGVWVNDLAFINGFGWQLAGGILNNGDLTLERAIVAGNVMGTDAGDFWQGGGGIYSGDGATLTLVDSTVSDNTAQWSGGGVYSFFNTTTTIVRSTISGNVSNDVGGGLRLLGNAWIENSTISGNVATGWHGGAIFQTDGDVSITNSTIANNIAPDYAPSTLFIGQFGGGFVPTLTLTSTIITGNQWYSCEKFASGTVGNVVSGGYNVVQDDSCNPVPSDQIIWEALIGPLANNGGPTQTHALLPGSPAIDAADNALCPAEDQRGAPRDDGFCDVGAFEVQP